MGVPYCFPAVSPLVKTHMESYSAQRLVLQVRVSGWSLFLIMPADPSFDHMACCVPSFPSVWDRLTVLLYLGNFHWQGFMLSLFIPEPFKMYLAA